MDIDLFNYKIFGGRAETNNSIEAKEFSPLLSSNLNESWRTKLPAGYEENRVSVNWHTYFLVDVIYPKWAIFGPNHVTSNEK